jgi:hypothetical protein
MAVTAQPGCLQRLGLRFRYDGDAMHALLAGEMNVLVARRLERLPGKLILQAFNLLQAQDIRLLPLEEGNHAVNAEANRIDVPGRQGEAVHVVGEAVVRGWRYQPTIG